MTNEEIQSIMNSTFSGLAIFCRDSELDEKLLSRYAANQIIMERGFTDLSHKIGGMAKNCRFLVASSNGKDLSMFSQNPELGHITIQSGAFFKVLDIQKEGGKTQILLLNIPEEGVPIFSKSKVNIEDQVIDTAKQIFRESISSEPLVELQSDDWIERTSYPLGMSQEGVFFLDIDKSADSNKDSTKVNEQNEDSAPLKEESIETDKPEKKGF